jgi:peptide/nickel transport system substrate-binding protein
MFRNEQKKTKWFLAIGVAVCFAVFMLAVPGTTKADPKGEATFLVPTAFEMTGGDPHTMTGATASTIISLLYDSLVIKYVDGKYHPAIAKSWKVETNWKFIRFNLDRSASFHDGTPVTAEDVKYSLERQARMKGYWAPAFRRYIERVDVDNPDTVTVYFKEPYLMFFVALAKYLGIVPKHYVEKVGDVEFAKKPIGAGPFKIINIKQDVHVKVEAVNNHYRKTPNVKYLNELHVAESATRFAMLKAGEADLSWADPPTYQSCVADPNLTIIMSKYTYLRTLAFYDLAFPDEKSPFHDLRVRQATAYAIDYKGITKYVMHDTAEPYGDIFPPYATGYDPSIKPIEYNPEKAKALLKEAGYPNGFNTVITSDPPMKDSTEAISASLKKVGIQAKVNIPEHGAWNRMVREKKLRGLGSHPGPWWSGYTHPGLSLNSHLGKTSDWVYYNLPEIAEAVESLMLKTDEKEMIPIAREISKKYRGQLIRANLFAIHIPYVYGPRVKYWRNVPGHIFSSRYEFLELK